MGNFSFKTTGLPEPVNGVVEAHNFTQGAPHTAIYAGQTGLTFRRCNLINCDTPEDSLKFGCNTSQISFCSHNNPMWNEAGYITTCTEDCLHLTGVDTILIDGVAVDTHRSYEDKGVL